MDEENKNTGGTSIVGGSQPISSSLGMGVDPEDLGALSLDPSSLPDTPHEAPVVRDHGNFAVRVLKRADVILVALLIVGAVALFATTTHRQHQQQNAANTVTSRYNTVQLPLSDFIADQEGLNFGQTSVVINGSLQVHDGLVVVPTVQPNSPKSGQLYFDQNTNQLAYYNGAQFVPLVGNQQVVNAIGGLTGNVTLGGGLSVVGNQLVATANGGVLSIGGQAGQIALGNGLKLNANTLQNAGVVTLAAGTPNLVIVDDGNGNLTISNVGAGTGTVTSPGGTAGQIPLFNSAQDIGDSLLSQSGGTVTANGNLSVTGTFSLASPLNVNFGGTGTNSLAVNGLLLGQGSGAVTTVTAGSPGLCLISNAGAPSFQTCPGSPGAVVSSLDGLTGALTISSTSGSGATITLDDATTTTKGIASFNSTNFAVTGGAVNTIQNINSAATPSFAGVNTNNITPGSSLTVGSTAQSFTLQGSGASTITATSGASTTTLSFQAPTANVVYRFATAAAGAYDVCTTAANCAGSGGGVTTSGGTTNTIAKFTGAQTLGNSLLTDNGSLVTVGGNLSVTGSLTLGTALGVGQGGTGAASLTTNGVVIGQGASALTTVTAVSAGQCLVSTAGAPTFTTCPGSGGVASLNGLTGALTLANATGSGSTVTIDNATNTGVKGIATFNSTNFSVSAGAVNTVQDIATTADPTFRNLTLSTLGIASNQATNPMLVVNNTNAAASGVLLDLQLNGVSKFSVQPNGNVTSVGTLNGQTISNAASFTGTLGVAGAASLNGGASVTGTLNANTITPTGAMTVGAAAQSLTLQGNASTTLVAHNGANATTISFQSPAANVTYRFLTTSAGTYDICTTAGNCVGAGGGVTTAGGTTNTIPKFTGAQTLGDSLITDNGTVVTVGGTLSVNTLTPTGALTVGSTSQNLTLQGATTQLTSSSAGVTNALTFATPSTTNKTITIPNASGTVAVSASGPLALDANGNITCATCVTSGGGGGGAAAVDSLDGLTGALTIANSTGSSTTITIDDASTTGKGIAQFNSSNFSVASGVVNTIQNIGTAADPTFRNLTLSTLSVTSSDAGNLIDLQLNGSSKFSVTPAGNLTTAGTITSGTINGQTISASASFTGTLGVAGAASLNGGASVTGTLTANTITPTGALTVGATGQTFTLQGDNLSTITATGGGFTTTVGFTGAPTGAVRYNFDRAAAAGTYAICTTAGNCASGGNVNTAGGTTNAIPKFTGAATLGDSNLSDDGTTVSVNGNLALAANKNLVLGAGAGTISQAYNATSGTATTIAATDTAGSGTTAVLGLAVNLTGTNNASGSNTVTGINFGNVTAATNNSFYGLNFGTGFNDLLRYNGTQLISGSGLIQNAAIDSTLTYSNLTKLGALTAGSIASGFGTISTTNNITTTTAIQGGTGIFTAANALTLGTASANTGAIVLRGSGNGNTLTLQGPNSPAAGNFTLSLPAITASATVCTDNSVCSGYAAASGSGSYIQNQNAGQQSSANFWISGTGRADTALQAPLIDTASAAVLSIGTTNATAINLNQNTVVGAGKSITITGGNTASRPASPTEGMVYYDTTTKALLTYANGKWQADRSTANKIVAMGTASGCTGSSPVASANPDGADFVTTSCTSAQTVINSAISALPSSGGIVYLMEGTYITSGAITVPANVKLVGAGNATIIKLADSTNASVNMINVTGDNASVQDLLVDQNTANQTSGTINSVNVPSNSNVTVKGIKAINIRSTGIVLATNDTASDNVVDCTNGSVSASTSATAISLTGSARFGSSAVGNTISNCDTGILANGSNDTISGNTITEARTTGINLNSTSYSTVTGNTVDGLSGTFDNNYASTILNGTTSLSTITGNNFAHAFIVISLSATSTTTISANRLYESNNVMVSLAGSSNTVTGNISNDSTANQGGFTVTAASTVLSSNTVARISSSGAGNSIVSNRFTSNNASLTIIDITASNNLVSDNNISSIPSGVTGIAISSAATGTYLSNNTYTLVAGGTAISDAGIDTVYSNQVTGNGDLIVKSTNGVGIGQATTAASLSVQGAYVGTALPAPAAPTLSTSGTAGSTSYTYAVTALDGLGETLASTTTTIATGNATLTGTNKININWVRVGGAVNYRVYRTASGGTPSSTGLIGTVAASASTMTFSDTGLAGSGSTPSSNTTGGMSLAGGLQGTTATFGSANAVSLGTTGTATGAILFKGATAASGTLTFIGPSNPSTNTITLPNETGTVCTTGSVCAGYAASSGSSSYIQNQNAGVQSSANFWISGTGRADTSLLTPSVDATASTNPLSLGTTNAGSVSIGNTSATVSIEGSNGGINIGNGATNHTIQIGTGAGIENVTLGSTNSSSSTTIQAGTGNILLQTNQAGAGTIVKSTTNNSATAFQIQNSGGNALLTADTVNKVMTIGSSSTGGDLVIGPGDSPYIFSDGFESGNYGLWSGSVGAPTIDTVHARTGKYAAKIAPSASQQNASWVTLTGASSSMYARGYFYSTAHPAASTTLFYLSDNGATTHAIQVLRQASTGNLGIKYDNNAATFSGTPLALNGWHKIELVGSLSSSGTGVYKLWYDGTQLFNVTNATGAITDNIEEIQLGDDSGTATQTFWADDLAVGASLPTVTDSSSLTVTDSAHIGGSLSVNGVSYFQNATTLNDQLFVGTNGPGASINSEVSMTQSASLYWGEFFNGGSDVWRYNTNNGDIGANIGAANGGLSFQMATAGSGASGTTVSSIKTILKVTPSAVELGQDSSVVNRAANGTLIFKNSGNTNGITLQTSSGAAAYTLTLPTTAPGTSQCLQTDNVSSTQLKFVACTAGISLAKNATDTSSAAVTASNFLYTFTNSSSALASGVLKLDNGTNTNSALSVTASGNPGASQALIFASNTNASPSGNLIDLQSGSTPSSKFSVNAAGNVTAAGTYNSNTFTSSALTFGAASTAAIQSAASQALTITANAASTWSTSSGLLTLQGAGGVTVNSPNVSGASGAILVQSGNSSTGTAGNVTLDTGTTSTGTPTVNIGNTNAKAVQIGNNTSNPAVTIDSGTGTIAIGTGAQARTINFGTGAAVQGITIGSTNTTSSTSIQGGATGSVNIGSVGSTTTASTTNIATTTDGTSTQTVNVGGTANVNSAVNIQGGTTGGINIGTVSAGTTGSTVHIADTSNATGTQSVTIGSNAKAANALTLQAGTTGGINLGAVGASTAGSTIHIADSSNATGTQAVTLGSTANTANTTTLQGNTILLQTNSNTGAVTVKSNTNSTVAFQVQNTGGNPLLAVDTSTNAVRFGTAASGLGSLFFSTVSGTDTGFFMQSSAALSSTNIQYTMMKRANNKDLLYYGYDGTTFWNYLQNDWTNKALTINDHPAGITNIGAVSSSTNGTTIHIADTNNSTGVQAVTIGSSANASNAITVESGNTGTVQINNGATAHTTSIASSSAAAQAVTIGSTNASSITNINGGGNINLASNAAAAGLHMQTNTNSSAALQVQNSASDILFNMTTTAKTDLLTNPSFETNTTAPWATINGGTITLSRVTTQSYSNTASMQVAISTATQWAGVKYPVTLTDNTSYTISFFVKSSSGNATIDAGYSSTGAFAGEGDCVTNFPTIYTTGWTRFSCTFLSPATHSGTPYIYIEDPVAAASTFWIDNVQLTQSATDNGAYYGGLIDFTGSAIGGQLSVQPTNDSTSAFQVFTSAGKPVLQVDTINSQVMASRFVLTDNFTDSTKAWRFRTDGSGLDFETAGGTGPGSMWITGWSNTGGNFSGTQYTFLRTDPTLNGPLVTMGAGFGTATPTLTVLDTKNTSGDPSYGTNGAMYYNSNTNKFRCFENSAWKDCIGGFNTVTKTADQAATQSSTTLQSDNTLTFSVAANSSYIWTAWIPVDDSNTAADLRYSFAGPTGSTTQWMTHYTSAASTADTICNSAAFAAGGGLCRNTNIVNSAADFIVVNGFVTTGGTSGSVTFQFAQDTSAAASFPVIKKGATLSWHTTN